MDKKVVTRFAPSPTGYMHIGGVRTALYAFAFAKKNKGTFILRIEDTDKEREVAGSIPHIIESLKWLGITWDEGVDIGGPSAPYLQSERLSSYRKYADILIKKGLAYADPYTAEEVDTFRQKSESEKRPFLFRDYRPENPPEWDGSTPLRFKVTNIKEYSWNDLVRGRLSAGVEALDDFVLIKSDGYPTYNFAHIIDDLEMGVTHIMRADEFVASTPKFLSLYEALEIDPPKIATLPPIMAPDGKKKLGKRDGAKDILEYRNEGYLPEAMMNFLAMIGWNPGTEKEIFTSEEFIDAFDISQVQHSGGKFNDEKLNWFNREHIKRLSEDQKLKYLKEYIPKELVELEISTDDYLRKILPILTERISYFGEIQKFCNEGEYDYFWKTPNPEKNMLSWKNQEAEATKLSLENTLNLLNESNSQIFNSIENVKEVVGALADKNGRGEVLWPLRVALSGKEKSPDPYTLLYILGEDESKLRISRAIELM